LKVLAVSGREDHVGPANCRVNDCVGDGIDDFPDRHPPAAQRFHLFFDAEVGEVGEEAVDLGFGEKRGEEFVGEGGCRDAT